MEALQELTQFLQFKTLRGEKGPDVVVFRDKKTSVEQQMCSLCKSYFPPTNHKNATLAIGPSKLGNWPDFLFALEPIFSQRVVEKLLQLHFTGFNAFEANLRLGETNDAKTAPKYYLIEVIGRLSIKRHYFDEDEGTVCPNCLMWRPRPNGKVGWGGGDFVVERDSWDGSDFAEIRNLSLGNKFCSPRVLELARDQNWTGFTFFAQTRKPIAADLRVADWEADLQQKIREKCPDLVARLSADPA